MTDLRYPLDQWEAVSVRMNRSAQPLPSGVSMPIGSCPDNLRDSATAEALQAIVDLDLDVFADIQPPRGFGRD
jgi:hypothetical protein